MNGMRYKDFVATVAYDAEDRLFVGRIAAINDVVGFHADTVDGLEQAFREAVDDYVATCASIGKAPQKPFSGRVMFRLPPELHARAARAAEMAGKSLNQWAEGALREAAERGGMPAR